MKIFNATFLMGLALFICLPFESQATIYTSTQIVSDPPDDTYYYEYTEIIFADDVTADGDPVNANNTFQLPATGKAKITVALFNDEPLLTKEIVVEVYSDENELVDQFSIEVKEDWNWFKFVIDIDKPGTYTIDLYNEIDVYINSGSVVVVK
jgi:hypothetical protein